jgi:hypothetical protein
VSFVLRRGQLPALVAVAVSLLFGAARAEIEHVVLVPAHADLAPLVAHAEPGTEFRLAAGVYDLHPVAFVESLCGNCPDPHTTVPATYGLRLTGAELHIVGDSLGRTVLRTHAGYGLFFEDCADCLLKQVTVTGGVRDTSGAATDAAVVARRARVTVRRCRLTDNLGDSAIVARTVVGIMGICGREGSALRIEDNDIVRNSWDGIALYRDAEAWIRRNRIDGVDLAAGGHHGGGRGVGIGLTWNARALVERNLVTHYWKGIGVFVNAQATVTHNIVENVATWGLALWDADTTAHPSAVFRENAVYNTGACGVILSRHAAGPPDPGELTNNIFAYTGQDRKYDSGEPYCTQAAIAREAVPHGFRIEGNVLLANREPGERPGAADAPADTPAPESLLRALSEPAVAWTKDSAFLARYGEKQPLAPAPRRSR